MAEIEETVDDGSDCEDLVEEAYAYLVYPECVRETKKRVIRRKAAKLTISVEGELLYKHKQGKEKSLEERQKILLACHIDSTSGHMGKTRTLYRIKERFMWHGMVKDVVSLLSKCDVCQCMNRKLTTGVRELHPIPVKAPWYMVGIDFIGPLSPVAKDGSRYILTISDYFTKWVEVVPTVNKMASTVASSLFKANGLDERFNQTLQNMLVKYVDMWSHYLDTCAFAYNTSRHDSTKYTPFMLMFGRRATLPIDVELERQCSEDLCKTYWELEEHPYPAVFSEHARILEEAKGNIIAAQLRQKEAYDKKHCKPGQFQCDQLLLLVFWQALILLKMIQIVTKEANLKTIHHPVIVPIKMTVLTLVALTALYWRIVQFLLNEIPFLCQVYRTSICESAGNSFLAVNVATVQKQRGSDDCGVFAIAFALHAALGHCLEEIEFDQATMRDHLLKCYTTRNITSFPTKKVKRASHTLIMNIDVFCSCQMPDTYGDMMQCGLCEQWFHIKCVSLHSLPSNAEEWNCSLCT
eukprot:Em0033g8a